MDGDFSPLETPVVPAADTFFSASAFPGDRRKFDTNTLRVGLAHGETRLSDGPQKDQQQDMTADVSPPAGQNLPGQNSRVTVQYIDPVAAVDNPSVIQGFAYAMQVNRNGVRNQGITDWVTMAAEGMWSDLQADKAKIHTATTHDEKIAAIQEVKNDKAQIQQLKMATFSA